MHIDKRTTWCFPKFIKKYDFLQVCSTEQVSPPSGQSSEYMLNSCRASLKHVVMHSV